MGPSGLVSQAFAFAHGILAADDDSIGIMDDTVADGVCQCRFADFLVPAAHLKLRAENGGCFFVPAFRNFEQISGFGVLKRVKQPFVQNQQLDLLVLLDDLTVCTLGAGDGQFSYQLAAVHQAAIQNCEIFLTVPFSPIRMVIRI